jgi:hypothetical protein
MGAGNDVELELQKLRGELGSGSTPELEAGTADGSAASTPQNHAQAPRPAAPPADGAQPTIPASDVGQSAIPASEPPRTGDGT